jgi:hypothetical protein
MAHSRFQLDPESERLRAVVRHLHFFGGLSIREIVGELRAMGLVDRRGQPFPMSRVWTILRARQSAPS